MEAFPTCISFPFILKKKPNQQLQYPGKYVVSITCVLNFQSSIFILSHVLAFMLRDLLVYIREATSLCINVYKNLNHVWASSVLRLQPTIPADTVLLLNCTCLFSQVLGFYLRLSLRLFDFEEKICKANYNNLWISIIEAILLQIVINFQKKLFKE